MLLSRPIPPSGRTTSQSRPRRQHRTLNFIIMTLYSIRDWSNRFENNRTRELKKLDWVPISNNQDSDAYTELMEMKDGVSIFGVWIAIVQVASKCSPRGKLVRESGIPHTAESLSRITRVPKNAILRSFAVLLSIRWLESESYEIPQEGATLGADTTPPGDRAERKKEGKEGKEGNVLKSTAQNGFPEFWDAYPRKVARKDAEKAWEKAGLSEKLPEVLKAVESQKQSDQWKKDSGTFIPYPATWINQGRWEDVIQKKETEKCW